MTVCATCSRELQPEWKYCIYCGTRTGVPLTAAIDIIRAEELTEELASAQVAALALAPSDEAPAPATEPAPIPEPVYDNTDTGVLRIEDIPPDEPATAPADSKAAKPEARINVLAIIALVLGCLISPLAAVFGHIALSQIGRSGERGTAIAWVAVVLGYLSLAALLVLGISYLVLNS